MLDIPNKELYREHLSSFREVVLKDLDIYTPEYLKELREVTRTHEYQVLIYSGIDSFEYPSEDCHNLKMVTNSGDLEVVYIGKRKTEEEERELLFFKGLRGHISDSLYRKYLAMMHSVNYMGGKDDEVSKIEEEFSGGRISYEIDCKVFTKILSVYM